MHPSTIPEMADCIPIKKRNVSKTTHKGTFYCPHCDKMVPYRQKELWKYCHCYFIPVSPTEKMAEYVKCGACGMRYTLDVLKISEAEMLLPEQAPTKAEKITEKKQSTKKVSPAPVVEKRPKEQHVLKEEEWVA